MLKMLIRLSSSVLDAELTDVLESVEYSENIMDSNLNLSTGICEQYVNVSFRDVNGTFRKLALNNSIEAYDTTIQLYTLDVGSNTETYEGTFTVRDWDIDLSQEIVSFNGRDPSYQFNDITVSMSQLRTITATDVIRELFSYVNYTYNFDEGVQEYCNKIILPNSFYRESSLYDLLNKACELALLRIYWYKGIFRIGRVII